MNNLKPITLVALITAFGIASFTVNAGQIYRFKDESGVTTMSKILPPHAAQNGYDILDEKSFRLIEQVKPALTPEQIIEEEKQIAAQKEAERLAETAEKERKEQLRQETIYNNNLLASYQSEQDLLRAKATQITYLFSQLSKTEDFVTKNNAKLHQLQQQAAETEISGKSISTNFQMRLDAVQQELENNHAEIKRLKSEIKNRDSQFSTDLIRLRELLSSKQ